MDVTLSSMALIFLAPLMALIALVVFIQDFGPVFYVHTRVGREGRAFGCMKFRSMRVDAAERLEALLAVDPLAKEEWERDQKLKVDPRLTPVGGFLRRASLDELPQLINIFCGDMSIVGPRPIVTKEIERYGEDFVYYKSVRPGLTGLWQVSGRSDLSYNTRVELDAFYVQRQSLFLDIKIMILTVPAILLRRGSY